MFYWDINRNIELSKFYYFKGDGTRGAQSVHPVFFGIDQNIPLDSPIVLGIKSILNVVFWRLHLWYCLLLLDWCTLGEHKAPKCENEVAFSGKKVIKKNLCPQNLPPSKSACNELHNHTQLNRRLYCLAVVFSAVLSYIFRQIATGEICKKMRKLI